VTQLKLQATTIRSVGRVYGQGVTRVTEARPRIKYIEVQNRDNKAIYFWFGPIPIDVLDLNQGFFPDDPADWTAQQQTDAGLVIKTYGLELVAGGSHSLGTPSTMQVYSYVETGSAVAHLFVG